MNNFRSGEQRWIDGLGNLRNTIRQELITRQLAPHAKAGMTVLDVGQGTQLLALAAHGCRVTGVEPSPELRTRCAGDASGADLGVANAVLR